MKNIKFVSLCIVFIAFIATFHSPSVFAQAGIIGDFFQAIKLDKAPMLRQLLERGVDPNAVDSTGQPALHIAAREKSFDALKVLLLAKDIKINQLNPQDESVLMLIALQGNRDLLAQAIKLGAEVNKTGWTALHYAAAGGHFDSAKLLLEEHAYIDAESANKTTPLMMAARMKHLAVAEFLVTEGADPTVRNEAGLSAADYLIRIGEPTKAQWMVDQAREFRRKYRFEPTAPGVGNSIDNKVEINPEKK